MYRDKQFRVRKLEHVLEDINMARDHYGPDVRRAFLCDGDAMALPTRHLVEILTTLELTFPELQISPDTARITVWARDHVLLTGVYTVNNMGTGSESGSQVPTLNVVAPNPLRGDAAIEWTIPSSTAGEIAVVDLAGRTVESCTLQGTAGVFNWAAGESPAGVYFIRMTTQAGDVLQKRLVVIR